MTLCEVGAIYAYWQDHPPTHLLVSALLGANPRLLGRGASHAPAQSQMSGIPGLKEGAVEEGLKPAALDFEELKRHRQGIG